LPQGEGGGNFVGDLDDALDGAVLVHVEVGDALDGGGLVRFARGLNEFGAAFGLAETAGHGVLPG